MTTNLIAASIATTVLMGSSILGSVSGPLEEVPLASKQNEINTAIYPEGKEWWEILAADPELTELFSCESGCKPGSKNCDHGFNPLAINHGDSQITGYPSYSLGQFQPPTFLTYVRKYNVLPNAEDEEVANMRFDPFIQIYLVRRMIDDQDYGHWYNCYVKKGLWDKYH